MKFITTIHLDLLKNVLTIYLNVSTLPNLTLQLYFRNISGLYPCIINMVCDNKHSSVTCNLSSLPVCEGDWVLYQCVEGIGLSTSV